MLTRFEHFAVTSMMGAQDTPPRANGSLCFSQQWEREAFGVALALARDGHFEWEEFRQNLIASIGEWESAHALDDPSWNYYEQWLAAFEKLLVGKGLVSEAEIDARASELQTASPV
ncbi:putative transmembrane nitrile hydratase [Methylocella silvestris BL2]|uniref:Putative transmembrane nitrile hydratase n=1 Tax=Methylocella silvestris (strain DSM 15510 / CIP 108128 / LMG 27833 / NCIMB 13906 / BL2) TaxID=395965 RepID=B8ETJ9_METSB|nr:nitrile hydratase accessory protein [Methylocella silvestris]ACK52351.1 putative transmembrane nitrile hydratase [Methylocella silvestris BL2]